MKNQKNKLKQSCHIHNTQEKIDYSENILSPQELEVYDFFFDLAG